MMSHPTRRALLLTAAGAASAASLMRARAAQPPAADARVYVDAIRGDDKADGRTPSTAFKTLGTALKARPLWLGLARNARFAGSLLIRTPMTVEAYGDDEPPVVDAAAATVRPSARRR